MSRWGGRSWLACWQLERAALWQERRWQVSAEQWAGDEMQPEGVVTSDRCYGHRRSISSSSLSSSDAGGGKIRRQRETGKPCVAVLSAQASPLLFLSISRFRSRPCSCSQILPLQIPLHCCSYSDEDGDAITPPLPLN